MKIIKKVDLQCNVCDGCLDELGADNFNTCNLCNEMFCYNCQEERRTQTFSKYMDAVGGNVLYCTKCIEKLEADPSLDPKYKILKQMANIRDIHNRFTSSISEMFNELYKNYLAITDKNE